MPQKPSPASAGAIDEMSAAFASVRPSSSQGSVIVVAVGFDGRASRQKAIGALKASGGLSEKTFEEAVKNDEGVLASLGVSVAGLSSTLRSRLSAGAEFAPSELAVLDIVFKEDGGRARFALDGQEWSVIEHADESLRERQVAEALRCIQDKSAACSSAGESLLTIDGLGLAPPDFQKRLLARIPALEGFGNILITLERGDEKNIPPELAQRARVLACAPSPGLSLKNLAERREAGEAPKSSAPGPA